VTEGVTRGERVLSREIEAVMLLCLLMPPRLALGAELAESPAAERQAPVVESVEVRGSRYLPAETIFHYMSTKAGDRFDEERLQEDFRRLWSTGFLDDLIFHVDDGRTGKIVTVQVDERRRVQLVDYRGSKALSRTAVEEELKKRKIELRTDSFYDLRRARRVEAAITAMLAEKGRPFGKVRHELKPIGGGVHLSFVIDDGDAVRVKEIDFVGNRVVSDRALRRAMKNTKQRGFWSLSWLHGKTTYTEEKWNGSADDPGDAARIRDFYLNRGYVLAAADAPRVSYIDGQKGFLFWRKPARWARLEIPVTEGDRYRVGEVEIEGLTIFKAESVLQLFKLKPGDVYRESRLKKGYDKLRDLYGSQGYFQWTAATRRRPDADRKVVDVTLAMEEDKRYYVGRIEFVGNDLTRDKVIRREVYLNEGDVFNTEALKLSIRRINQMGYFKAMEGPPELSPSRWGDDRLDVTFKVEEQNRNQFTFGAGVSGIEGAFVNASFQTTNFLGRGETVTVSAQTGGRTKNYQVAVTEPYLFDRPITAGADVFFREVTYLSGETLIGYTQWNQGVALTSGLPFGRFGRLYASYSYQIIDIFNIDKDAQSAVNSAASAANDDAAPAPVLDTGLLAAGRRYESRLTPSLVLNTVDNPHTPRSGSRYTATLGLAGGVLQGTVNYLRPTLELIHYVPVGKRMALGIRGEAAYVRPFGRTEDVPYYDRFFLGGETQVRGYDARTVAPVNPGGDKLLGGDKYLLFNAEYYFDVAGPLRLLLFFDAGEAYAEGQSFRPITMRTSMGAEARIVMPVLNVPFRLIYAYNANRDRFQPATAFKFAVGTTF
jgi:outer membrane protein insertion porin family